MAEMSYKEDNWAAVKHADDQVCCRALAQQLKQDLGYTSVDDVSLNPSYQVNDIDLVATDAYGNQVYYEVKADDYHGINGYKKIFIETKSNDVKNTDGWVYTTQAHYIVYVMMRYNTFVIIDAAQLRQYVINNINYWTDIKKTGTYKNRQLIYRTYGYVRSIDEISNSRVYCQTLYFNAANCELIEEQQRRKVKKKRAFDANYNSPPPEPPTNIGFTITNNPPPSPQTSSYAEQPISSYVDQNGDLWEVYPATPDNCPFLDPQSA